MRKAVFLISLITSLIVVSTAAHPAELNLGPNNFTIKLDSIQFNDNALEDFNNAFFASFRAACIYFKLSELLINHDICFPNSYLSKFHTT